MRHTAFLLAIAIAATASSSAVAFADTFPPVFYSVGLEFPVQVFQQELNTPGYLSGGFTGASGSGTTTASLSTLPSPFLFASFSGTGTGTGTSEFIGSESEVLYYFEVLGPPGPPVPVSIFAFGNTGSSGAGIGVSEVIIELPGVSGIVTGEACSDSFDPTGCMSNRTSFNGTNDVLITPGVQVGVFVLAAVESFDNPGVSFAAAEVDPYIFIDPSFADASLYSIEVSPGVGNSPPTSPIPEPSTLALLGTGVLGLAGAARRKSIR